jgi:hypothetical protein
MKREFAKRFKKEFPKLRLLAVQLNGFSHRVICDDKKASTKPLYLEYSGYLSSSEISDKDLNDKLSRIFLGVSHHAYQGNAQEIVYVQPHER